MNDFIKRIALSTCIMFTSFMTVGCLIGIAFAGPQAGLIMTLTFLAAAIAFAALQSLWFTDKLIRHLAYPARILGFGITAFAVLIGCAAAGSWFPLEEPWAWLSFAAIYLVILVACCIGYQIHFKRTVGSFDAALQRYHERMGR